MYFVNPAPKYKSVLPLTFIILTQISTRWHGLTPACVLCTKKYCGQKRVSGGLGFRAKVIKKLFVDFDRALGDEPWG